MEIKAIEHYLHEHIPISKAMGVNVLKASLETVELAASYDKNINHKKTVFGGSLQAVAILSCWTLLWLNVHQLVSSSQIVIAHSEVDYKKPVESDFIAKSFFPAQDKWGAFKKALLKKKKARITMESSIYHRSELAVAFQGVFVIFHHNQVDGSS